MKAKLNLLICILLGFSSFGQIQLQFDYSEAKETKNLIGFNTGFNHKHWVQRTTQNNKHHYFTGNIRADIVDEMSKISKPVMRFPGGVVANFYHLYENNSECLDQPELCGEENFAKGYGIKGNEANANGNNLIITEYNQEQDANVIDNNWIVAFSNLLDAYHEQTNDEVEVILMANVLPHFKFGGQAAQFSGNTPNVSSIEFQRVLNETKHILKYLIEVRGFNVTRLEMGTELYFGAWNVHDVTVDRFIELIPIYRDLLDDLGYEHIELGVPIYHEHNLGPNANNWTRKLADANYHSNHMYDAFIIHDYTRMAEQCNPNIFEDMCVTCAQPWPDDECTLFTGDIDCRPQNHHPNSVAVENVFKKKIDRHADYFNGGITDFFMDKLTQLRTLSGDPNKTFWMTEWNLSMDSGCSGYKAVNQFFSNTFLHGIMTFELIHTLYEKNRVEENRFMDITNFHSFGAGNSTYPIMNIGTSSNPDNVFVKLNASFYPLQMASIINEKNLKKVSSSVLNNDIESDEFVFHVYLEEGVEDTTTYIFYTNKTDQPAEINFNNQSETEDITEAKIKYVSAEAIHSAANGIYNFDSNNITVGEINYDKAEEWTDFEDLSYELPAYSFGYIMLNYNVEDESTVSVLNEELLPKFTIYPNPAKNLVNISTKDLHNENYEISIINSLGSELITKPVSNNLLTISTESLSSGVYFIVLKGEENSINSVKKLIIQK